MADRRRDDGRTSRGLEFLFRVAGTHPIEWVTAILELLGDSAARERLSANGRRRLAADYSREVVRGQLLGVIRDLGLAPLTATAPATTSAGIR